MYMYIHYVYIKYEHTCISDKMQLLTSNTSDALIALLMINPSQK